MHPTADHLLGGAASCAVVRPLKREGARALLALWRGLIQEAGGVSSRARVADSDGGGHAPGGRSR